MLVMLIFCSQQGYVVFKDYKKVTNKLANADKTPLKPRNSDKTFGLFTAAVRQADVPAAEKRRCLQKLKASSAAMSRGCRSP